MVPSTSGPVGADVSFEAVLLLAVAAVDALAAGVHHAADAYAVADSVLGDVRTHLCDDSGDLVARGQRVGLCAPVPADGVDVRVADAGELDLDEHIVGSDGRRSMVVGMSGSVADGAA